LRKHILAEAFLICYGKKPFAKFTRSKGMRSSVFIGKYLQGKDALNLLEQESKLYGQRPFLIMDSFVKQVLGQKLIAQFNTNVSTAIFGGECCDPEINRLSQAAKDHDVIIGVGGGKTLDTAKIVAHRIAANCIIVPTLASTDAPCSSLAVVYTPEGAFLRYEYFPKNPDVILVDSTIIAQAPVRFLVAGMGDALSTWFEAQSCAQKNAPNRSGYPATLSGMALAKLCYETVMTYGVLAKFACEQKVVTPALEHLIEANIFLSGAGFENGGLAAAHAIHDGLTVLEPTHAYYHGEKVAFSTLASLFLTGKDGVTIKTMYAFYRQVGLPTTLADLGLGNVSREDLLRAAQAACIPEETIHNEPIPVDPDIVLAALLTADEAGRADYGQNQIL
jgi:glycerol dehydrogenase